MKILFIIIMGLVVHVLAMEIACLAGEKELTIACSVWEPYFGKNLYLIMSKKDPELKRKLGLSIKG